MSFSGGKLKLKGGKDVKLIGKPGGVDKKKKKKDKKRVEGEVEDEDEVKVIPTPEGYILPPRANDEDMRTEAEKKYEERMRRREEEKLKKMA